MTKFLDDRLGEIFQTPKPKGLHTSLDTFLNDPFFIQALKDFESLGFIKIKKEGVEILDRKGLEKYLKDFGTLN